MHSFLMMSRIVLLVAISGSAAGAAEPRNPSPEEVQFFEKSIRPLLVAQCLKCHGPEKQQAHLRLDSRVGMLQGGDSGAAIKPGEPDESLLIKAIRYEELEMPPDRRLDEREVDALVHWIKMGATWPNSEDAPLQLRQPGLSITERDREFWSFRPIARPPIPAVRNTSWARNEIDQFVAARLEQDNLSPSTNATKRELIRRLYFDLLGLPPTYEQVEVFLADAMPDAYERLVDHLLSSPHYGERWGRHWLDVVRFAQSNGYERDNEKPLAWMYRDYVIRAMNADKPFDQFVCEQLAGDEFETKTDDSITATAFYRLGPWDDEPADKRQAEWDEYDEIVSTTGAVFLGLTIGCARCHDHKFDPIPQKDYYALTAFLRNIRRYGKDRSPTHYEPDEAAILVSLPSGSGNTLAVTERGATPPPTRLLIRGDSGNPGDEVQPSFVQVLCDPDEAAVPLPTPTKEAPSSGRRTVFADWVTSPRHPLTSRVIVNRLWHYHFGRGIVETPNDFGRSGLRPSHPELLDWLATELVRRGWSLKAMHRLIVTSSTYRQASRADNPRAIRADPANRLLWRQNLHRLEAEAIRDSVLFASGSLNLKMAGRGIFPRLPAEVLATQSRPGSGWDDCPLAEQARRSVYIFIKRTLGVPILETLDFASPDTSAPARATTTIAPQALILLNSSFIEEQAKVFADRISRETKAEPKALVERAFQLALARQPTADECRVALDFLGRQPASDTNLTALAALCKLMLNLNEFVYVD
jgi:hypothetical protein